MTPGRDVFFFFFSFKAFVNVPARHDELPVLLERHLIKAFQMFPLCLFFFFFFMQPRFCCQQNGRKFCLINYCSLSAFCCVSNAVFGGVGFVAFVQSGDAGRMLARRRGETRRDGRKEGKRKGFFKNATCWFIGGLKVTGSGVR